MVARIIVLFALFAVLCGLSNAQNYCNIKSCKREPHTACRFRSSLPSHQCTGVQQIGLTADEKRRVLRIHNELRQKVATGQEHRGNPGPQPAATNMADLTWDDELEMIAQRWTSQCDSDNHDSCRDVERFQVGQSMASAGTTADVSAIDVEQLVMDWYNEVERYNRNEVAGWVKSKDFNNPIGHYTQLVWAETTKLGCGAIKYKDGIFNTFFLVCNYGPAGNCPNKPVYQRR